MNNSEQTTNKENRKEKVLALYAKGYTQWQIAKELGVSQPTISRDLQELESMAKNKLIGLAKKARGLSMYRIFIGYEALINRAWAMLESQNDPRLLTIIAELYQRFYQHIDKCESLGHNYSDRDAPLLDKEIFSADECPDMFDDEN